MSSSPGSIMLKCTPRLAVERGRAKEINNVCVGLCKMGSDQRASHTGEKSQNSPVSLVSAGFASSVSLASWI